MGVSVGAGGGLGVACGDSESGEWAWGLGGGKERGNAREDRIMLLAHVLSGACKDHACRGTRECIVLRTEPIARPILLTVPLTYIVPGQENRIVETSHRPSTEIACARSRVYRKRYMSRLFHCRQGVGVQVSPRRINNAEGVCVHPTRCVRAPARHWFFPKRQGVVF